MPKISNNEIKIYHRDIDKFYNIEIFYNQQHHFYCRLPEEFKDIINHLSKDELEILEVVKDYKKKYSQLEYNPIIAASTEYECLTKSKKAITELLDKQITQSNVILVFFEPKASNYHGYQYNNEHPAIGLQLGLTYAIETTAGDKKVYSTYTERECFGEKKIDRHEIHTWGKFVTVIPDTSENREILEEIYENMKRLVDKLTEFTSSSEKMLELISNNIKMLTA